MKDTHPGRVVISHGADSLVEDAAGDLHRCKSRRSVGRPLCGDRVQWRSTAPGEGVVEQIEPRQNTLARPNYRNQLRPIAANVDQMVIVNAPAPGVDRDLIDRYLVLAEQLQMQPLIWLNKLDLLEPAAREALRRELAIYPQLGYALLGGSVKSGDGMQALDNALRGRTSILVGQSGVGKSSLTKALIPDLEVRIGALSEASGLGRHTTTETTLYHLAHGGDLIDSPGIRTLRLGHLSAQEIAQSFPELRPHLGRCRFRDCAHRSEPGCAIQAAAARGEIAPERLQSYYSLVET